jgi:hypothetical protein
LLAGQHNQLIQSGSIKLATFESSTQFIKLVETLAKLYKSRDATEKSITDAINTLIRYLEIFNAQLV